MKKVFCTRTKKRKVQRELDALGDWYIGYLPDDSNSTHNILPVQETLPNPNATSISSTINNSPLNAAGSDIDQSDQLIVEHNTIPTSNLAIENVLESSSDEFINIYKNKYYNQQENILQSLADWAVNYNVPQNTINKLLEILKYKAKLSFIPKDCRTLLRSNSAKVLNLRKVDPDGLYYHFGLRNGILRFSSILPLQECIQIAIGIDGLPISKSSSSQFWPILAYIMPYHKYVFPVGIFHGHKKPSDSNNYLHDFIAEVLELYRNGLWVNNQLKKIEIKIICCDSPAKAFILRVKGHSGYFSCTKCSHEGEYYINHVCFPYNENGNEKRSHEDYILMKNEQYHVSPTISCLALIPNVNIVDLFPLDYMHLVCLGVTKRLITLWLNKGPNNVRLPSWKSKKITTNLLKIKACITNDFARKPRGIEEVGRFKATEFRQFLLYTGPLVLKDVISKDCYLNFMTLSIAMRILLSSDYCKYLEYAYQLLEYFVKTFQKIYGITFMSHNVHGLLHLVEDYKLYGPLDNCSCFYFENYMKYLKRMLRKNDKPLQQVVNRYKEICDNENITYNNYDELNFTTNEPDCFILTTGGEIVKITDIVSQNNVVIGRQFLNKENLFNKPFKSSKLDIFIVKTLSETAKEWKITEIKKKIVMFNFNNNLISIPIIR